jgi:hypothetical protein
MSRQFNTPATVITWYPLHRRQGEPASFRTGLDMKRTRIVNILGFEL